MRRNFFATVCYGNFTVIDSKTGQESTETLEAQSRRDAGASGIIASVQTQLEFPRCLLAACPADRKNAWPWEGLRLADYRGELCNNVWGLDAFLRLPLPGLCLLHAALLTSTPQVGDCRLSLGLGAVGHRRPPWEELALCHSMGGPLGRSGPVSVVQRGALAMAFIVGGNPGSVLRSCCLTGALRGL